MAIVQDRTAFSLKQSATGKAFQQACQRHINAISVRKFPLTAQSTPPPS
jgi:hypothetical protein